MSTQIATQTTLPATQTRGSGQRGRRGNRARGTLRGGRGGGGRVGSKQPAIPKNTEEEANSVESVEDKATLGDDIATDEVVCFICAEPVKYYSLAQCNHRTCHVCALRLRALYKKLDCTFCKVGVLSAVLNRLSEDVLRRCAGPSNLRCIHGFTRRSMGVLHA